MKIIFLGSGGSIPIPRPLCKCAVCTEARQKGIPFKRTGPSIFLENESILFDTSEEIIQQFEREKISSLKHVFYTHWHPDHTGGMRIFEFLPEEKRNVKVYIPKDDVENFLRYTYIDFFAKNKLIKLIEYEDRTPIKIGSAIVTPLNIKRKDRVRYAFLVEKDRKKVLYAPDSIYKIKLDDYYKKIDLAILQMGWLGPTKATRKKAPKDSYVHDHISFEEVVKIAEEINAKKTIITHIDGIEHNNNISHVALCELGKPYNLEIAYDGMKVEI